MALEGDKKQTFGDGMIMSKPRSPFVKRWMEWYKDFDNGQEWNLQSRKKLHKVWKSGGSDITALPKQA